MITESEHRDVLDGMWMGLAAASIVVWLATAALNIALLIAAAGILSAALWWTMCHSKR